MKITPSNMSNLPGVKRDTIELRKDAEKAAPLSPEKVDKITIRGGSVTDAHFIDSLKGSILRDVSSGIDVHKLGDLKRQISSGEYIVNPSDIARRILGDDAE